MKNEFLGSISGLRRHLVMAVLFSLMAAFLGCSRSAQTGGAAKDSAPKMVEFCDLVSHGGQYLHLPVTVRVLVTSSKHVTNISSPACPSRALALVGGTDDGAAFDRVRERTGDMWSPFNAEITGTIELAPAPPTFVHYGRYVLSPTKIVGAE